MQTTTPEPQILENLSVLGLGSVLLARWRILLATPLGLALLTFIAATLWPKSYTASIMLSPGAAPQGAASPLASIASQFGVGTASVGVGSSGYYAQVLTGQNLLATVVQTRYPAPGQTNDRDSMTLVEYYDQGGSSAIDSVQRAVRMLLKHLVVEASDPSGVFTVQFDSHSPQLSLAVSRRLLNSLAEFNVSSRGSSARSRRVFLEQRLAAARESLDVAREAAQSFLESNRTWQTSPRLVTAKGRLDMELALKAQVQQLLATQYESARIDEVNDTPVLTVVDEPVLPTIPSSPQRLVLTALALVLGGLLGLAIVVLQEFAARLRAAGSQDFARLRGLAAEAGRDLIAPWRWLRRSPGGGS